MNTAEYVLAQFKRALILAIARNKAQNATHYEENKYHDSDLTAELKAFQRVMTMMFAIEADAVLGEETTSDEQYAAIGEEVE